MKPHAWLGIAVFSMRHIHLTASTQASPVSGRNQEVATIFSELVSFRAINSLNTVFLGELIAVAAINHSQSSFH